ncbi:MULTISPECIES: sensor histidine kinase [Xanthomonas]|uniref:histidine kinase n=1 Tax=Xanthomonas cucurbitae TaxID=56453 RepID=A0A2S7DUM2_9XANT|nr:HAMP domain-containing sensor histidine kinase [Xanthomonas cucurbitae]PPU77524.1 two-component sensor histidine kinase [Xanthomonas cucurbitae]QHG86139.1 sensor histidine kinase [Xanthomonas cucurbitae]WDM68384.1 HAMP domain-containing histidine kinase [Xanthomonas cucurbitae]WDM72257.1 HAMP domain-containing histidine kinase [Xanthomonas cucurbitae]WDM76052.1 HAMP domain-containing histidine kinase [Xanthomonas cucurbitae]
MPHGLPRKIRLAFLLQVALASLAIVLGGYLISFVIKYSLVRTVLADEAVHFWRMHKSTPDYRPPNTRNIQGYFSPAGAVADAAPAALRRLSPGFSEVAAADALAYVDQRPEGRLYLVFPRSRAAHLTWWFGVVPAIIVLLGIYGVSWFTYRVSKRLVSPISWLARRVSQWDPRNPDVDELAPERLPAELQGETRQLALALHALGQRVSEHVARERNFTRDASHELRTPLTVIRVASDMALADDDLPQRSQRSLRRIQRAGRDMEAVIDAFLILAREAEIDPQSETFDLSELASEEVDSARELLGDKPVSLRMVGDRHLQMFAPPRVMRVVLSNLLRNACAYTDTGSIEVEVAQDRIVVRDTGIGMTDEARARAFEPFFRADPTRPQGTGLGLSIVRRLCDRFGWRIELESQAGVGTSVAVVVA